MNKQDLLVELAYLKMKKIKPNFSDLSRKYAVDRHTISKYFKNGGKIIKKRKNQTSFYDEFQDEIIETLSHPGITKTAAYNYLCDKYGEKFHKNYNSFKSYTIRKDIRPTKTESIPHPRFETKPGEQLQVDWKESISMTTINGEILNFEIFTATLGYSRLHLLIYSKTKTTEDFIRCTIDCIRRMGGCPKYILTDNMTAVVSIKNGMKEKNRKIVQFEKDSGIKIKLCKARTPETKGKDESSNRFVNWLLPYDQKFKDESELISIIERINRQINQQINRTTNIPPIVLFDKEKEYLSPIPNELLLDSYIEECITQIVPSTMLVNYKGSGYSVPLKFINKRVKLYPIDNKLYIYYNDILVTVHSITNKKFNYKADHYQEALAKRINNSEKDIEKMASDNLMLFSNLEK